MQESYPVYAVLILQVFGLLKDAEFMAAIKEGLRAKSANNKKIRALELKVAKLQTELSLTAGKSYKSKARADKLERIKAEIEEYDREQIKRYNEQKTDSKSADS